MEPPVLRNVTKPSKDVLPKEAPAKDLAAALLVAVRLTQRLGLGELAAHELEFVSKVLAGSSCWLSEVNLERSPLLFACACAALNQACVLVSPSTARLNHWQGRLASAEIKHAVVEPGIALSPAASRGRVLLCRPEALEHPELVRQAERAELAVAIVQADLLAPSASEFSPSYEQLPQLLAGLGKPPLFALAHPIPIAERRAALRQLNRGDLGDLPSPLLAAGVTVEAVNVRADRQRAVLVELLRDLSGRGLLICATPHEVDATASVLRDGRSLVLRAHSGLPESAQRAAWQSFRDTEHAVLVTTAELPGTGLVADTSTDLSAAVPELGFVIRCHAPALLEQWARELNNLGRTGGGGVAVMFYDSSHRSLNEAMLEQHRLRASQLSMLVKTLVGSAGSTRPLTLEWLALQTGLSRRTTDRLLSMLSEFGALTRSAGRVVPGPAEAVQAASETLGRRLEALREADAARLQAVERLVASPQCRRRLLENYFGLESADCGECASCRPRERNARRDGQLG